MTLHALLLVETKTDAVYFETSTRALNKVIDSAVTDVHVRLYYRPSPPIRSKEKSTRQALERDVIDCSCGVNIHRQAFRPTCVNVTRISNEI